MSGIAYFFSLQQVNRRRRLGSTGRARLDRAGGVVVLSEIKGGPTGQTLTYSLRAGGIAVLLATVFGTADSAQAQYYGYYGGYGYGRSAPSYSYYPRHSNRHVRRATQSASGPSAKRAAAAEAKAPPAPPPVGPLTIAISIAHQRLTVFDQDKPIMETPVSTGMPGHPTPMGIFSVIQKDRYHHSNIYSGAPMPYMQRITWSGVAMHQGVLPGRPASHGCIRMPEAFAARLWRTTKMGVRVLIAQSPVAPTEFAHAKLPVPAKPTPVASTTPADLTASVSAIAGTQLAASETVPAQPAPANAAERVNDAINTLKVAPSAAPAAPVAGSGSESTSMPVIMAPFPTVARPATAEKPLPPGPIAIFVSRKERKIFVRKGFQPIFDAPVTIERADQPLGNHVFTAAELTNEGSAMRWLAVTMPGGERRVAHQQQSSHKGRRNAPVEIVQAAPTPNASDALDRITIPEEILTRISELLTPGSSLVVSDQGLGPETGKGTDFIVLTR
jgi:hypothetical protein